MQTSQDGAGSRKASTRVGPGYEQAVADDLKVNDNHSIECKVKVMHGVNAHTYTFATLTTSSTHNLILSHHSLALYQLMSDTCSKQ
jgi:hypothetical protein